MQAAPSGGDRHVVARVAAAWASGGGACAVEVAEARGGVCLGVAAGARDMGGAVGCETSVAFAVEGAGVDLFGLVAAWFTAAVGWAVGCAGVGASYRAGG